jgi:hypothetical protein
MAGMGGVLLSPAVLADTPALAEAARGEGTLTWYVSQLDAEEAESLGRTFTEAHPGVKVTVIRATGQVIFQRLLLDIRNQTPNCDVFSTSDISHMPILKDRGALARFVSANAAGLAPLFKALSDDGWYYVTNAGRYFMIHNTNRVAPADAPRKWTDLLDPKWKNQLAVAHPAFSGGTSVWVLTLKKRFGWSYFEALAKNNPRIGRSAVDPVTLLSGGAERRGVPGRGNLGAGRLSRPGQGQPARRRSSGGRHGGAGVSIRHPGARAASERGTAVHGMAAGRAILPPGRGRRQRAAAGGCRRAARSAADGRWLGDQPDRG